MKGKLYPLWAFVWKTNHSKWNESFAYSRKEAEEKRNYFIETFYKYGISASEVIYSGTYTAAKAKHLIGYLPEER